MSDEQIHETREYPLATEHLTKGSLIDSSMIEDAFRVQRGTDAYQLAVMRAIAYVTRRFLDRGEIVTVVQRKHDLAVLTDDEASTYNAKRFKNEIRSAGRCHARQLGVDRSQVSDAKLETHDRTLEVHGRMLAAMQRERRTLQPSPVQRQTPALVAGSRRRKKV